MFHQIFIRSTISANQINSLIQRKAVSYLIIKIKYSQIFSSNHNLPVTSGAYIFFVQLHVLFQKRLLDKGLAANRATIFSSTKGFPFTFLTIFITRFTLQFLEDFQGVTIQNNALTSFSILHSLFKSRNIDLCTKSNYHHNPTQQISKILIITQIVSSLPYLRQVVSVY